MATLYERLVDASTSTDARQREIINEYASNPLVQDALTGQPIDEEIAILESYRWRRLFRKNPVLEDRFAAAREIVDLRPAWEEIIGITLTAFGAGGQIGLYAYDQGASGLNAVLVSLLYATIAGGLLDAVLSKPVQGEIVADQIARFARHR